MINTNLDFLNYIHRSKIGVYKTFGSGIVGEYNQQKDQNYLKMMSRFKQNYIKTISQAPNEFLNAALNQEELIKEINNNSLNYLQETFSESLEKLSAKIIDLGRGAREYGVQYVQQYLENSNSRKARENFSKMFENIAKASEIVYGEESILAHILQSANTYGEIKNKLQQTRFNLNGKIISINNTEERKVIQYINNLISATETKTLLLPNGNINTQSFNSYFNNIFSTNFGENLLGSLVYNNPEIYKNVIDEVNALGAQNVEIQIDSNLSALAQQGTQVYKVDSQLKNFKVSVDVNGTSATIILDIGTSIKNYQSGTTKVSITGEKSLIYRLQQLFKSNRDLILSYNILANSDVMALEYAALKASLTAYFADIFISGIGISGDFAQYIVINGKFYSIYDILLQLKNYNTGGLKDNSIITVNPIGVGKITAFQEQRRKEEPKNLIQAYKNSKISMNMLQGLNLHASFYPNRYNALT